MSILSILMLADTPVIIAIVSLLGALALTLVNLTRLSNRRSN